MFRSLFARFLAVLLLATSLPALAEEAPDAQIKRVSDEVLTIVRQDKSIQAGDTKKTLDLIDAKVLPNFDFTRMTSLALGRDWRSATPAQRAALTAEFRTLLVRSYANALTKFKDYQIAVKPLKLAAGDSDVVVRTTVRKAGSSPDTVDYSLEKKDGQWKVYDVAVAGVSLITSYRDSFGQEVKAHGVDGLLASLKTKNAQNAAGNSKK
ncbi:MlaC/ttg2D family ABC transporter substrate-binding protein [Niveibacterium terrae]|uniref:MlaC/ttg2D family ABC transporter substrate-binding protein n=1 Tax=Niveibacterium terrae TaxID=3373598 RepID=UPI003A902190